MTSSSTTSSTTSPTTALNPTPWSGHLRFDQAQLRPAPTQLLTLAGQGDVAPDGTLCHPGDTAAQLRGAVHAVDELLTLGQMGWPDVTRLVVYTTDVDGVLAAYHHYADVLDASGARPPATLVGVARLALPGMAVEIDATAGR